MLQRHRQVVIPWLNGQAKENVLCFRGSEDDVLQRVVDAQSFAKSDVVVEINGDCILIDPEIVDLGVEIYLKNDADVVSNCRMPGYPMGFGVQVFSLPLLEKVAQTIRDEPVREHVSLYFYEHPEIYRLLHFFPPKRYALPEARFQLDYEEDLELIRRIYEALEPRHGEGFGLPEILELLEKNPELKSINQNCVEKKARN